MIYLFKNNPMYFLDPFFFFIVENIDNNTLTEKISIRFALIFVLRRVNCNPFILDDLFGFYTFLKPFYF